MQESPYHSLSPLDVATENEPAYKAGLVVKSETEESGPNGRNLRPTVDSVGSIRLILSTSNMIVRGLAERGGLEIRCRACPSVSSYAGMCSVSAS